ncbi:dirigent protein 15-like [Tripterygium wilfordii]|uniref:dirigent protein 15-like n=1 Tax=Tripterygium wilfordii TaxID=458696 RepID=UPI0018F86454|nr:dirigent protein 15-like [Tripterygium wilfordii]
MEAARTIFVCALIVFVAAVTANDDYQIEGPIEYVKAEKVTHLQFYLHDILSGPNPTAVRVAQSNRTTDDKSPTPFGSVYAIDDHLRVGPEPNSTIIGNAQGLYLVSSQDPSKFTIVMYADFELTTGKFNGSSISVFSRNPVYMKQRDLAIVGGRGQFRMARGFVLVQTSYFNGTNGDAILQYTATIHHY